MVLPDFLVVALGATAGAVLRQHINEVAAARGLGPWHIAGINIVGSGILGVVAAHSSISHKQRLLVGVGFCGALTTFSTFSVDVIKFLDAGSVGAALLYVALNNVGSIGAAYAGMQLGRRVLSPAAVAAGASSKTRVQSLRVPVEMSRRD